MEAMLTSGYTWRGADGCRPLDEGDESLAVLEADTLVGQGA